jgi:DNA-binding transcriptional MerR regulator
MNTNTVIVTKLLGTTELADAAGVGRETLRFYEEKGLVTPLRRTAAGYRQYDRSAIEVIGFIKETQNAGFTLKEIDELLQLRAKAINTCGNVSDSLLRKVTTIDEEIASLQRKRALIQSMNANCCPSPSPAKTCSFVPPSTSADSPA